MPVTRVNGSSISAVGATAASYGVAIGVACNVGDLIVVSADCNGTHATNDMTVQETTNVQNFVQLGEQQQGGASSRWQQTFYLFTAVALTGTETIQLQPYVANTASSFTVDVFRGCSGTVSRAVTKAAGASGGTANSPALGSAPPAGDLVLSLVAVSSGTTTPPSPFTKGSERVTTPTTCNAYVLSADGVSTYGGTWTWGTANTSSLQTVAFAAIPDAVTAEVNPILLPGFMTGNGFPDFMLAPLNFRAPAGLPYDVGDVSAPPTTWAADGTEAVTAGLTADATVTAGAGGSESVSAGITATAGVVASAGASSSAVAGATAAAQVVAASAATSAVTIGATADATVIPAGPTTWQAAGTEAVTAGMSAAVTVAAAATAAQAVAVGITANATVIRAAAATLAVTAGQSATGALAPAASSAVVAVTAGRSAAGLLSPGAAAASVAITAAPAATGLLAPAVAGGNRTVTAGITADASVAGLTQAAATEAATVGITASAVVIAAASATEGVTAGLTAVASSIDRAAATTAATAGITADATILPRTPIQAAATMAVSAAPSAVGRLTAAAMAQLVSQATIAADAGRVFSASATMAVIALPTITLETTTPRPSGATTSPGGAVTPRPGGATTTVAGGITPRPSGTTTQPST